MRNENEKEIQGEPGEGVQQHMCKCATPPPGRIPPDSLSVQHLPFLKAGDLFRIPGTPQAEGAKWDVLYDKFVDKRLLCSSSGCVPLSFSWGPRLPGLAGHFVGS